MIITYHISIRTFLRGLFCFLFYKKKSMQRCLFFLRTIFNLFCICIFIILWKNGQNKRPLNRCWWCATKWRNAYTIYHLYLPTFFTQSNRNQKVRLMCVALDRARPRLRLRLHLRLRVLKQLSPSPLSSFAWTTNK